LHSNVFLTFKKPTNFILTHSGDGEGSNNSEEFLKEGSADPVLTATAPGIDKNNTSTNNSITPTSYMNPSTSTTSNRRSSMSTSSEGATSVPYEVVYTEKVTENDGSEEVVTLHYAFDETNSTLFDEVAASESLLMLSEGRDSSRFQGALPFISFFYKTK
jgi:hypothetical protein